MRYLSFDIECCDGAHMCEFGYTLANEQLETVKQEVFTINPEKPFKLAGRDKQSDIKLWFTEDFYCSSPIFSEFYNAIKELLEFPDQIILGYAIENDIIFLKRACEHYKLPLINFDFVDMQSIYKFYSETNSVISLEKAIEQLELPQIENLHRSDDDALGVLRILKKLCLLQSKSIGDIIKSCPTARGCSKTINDMYIGNDLSEMLKALDRSNNYLSKPKKRECIKKFVDVVQPTTKIQSNELNETKICFSPEYELTHTKETIILIQLLANCACYYNTKVSDNDYYIATANELNGEFDDNIHSRYYAATHREDGHTVKVISLYDLCNILGISEESLSTIKMPTVPKHVQQNNRVCYSSGKATTTMADIFKSCGVNKKIS